MSNTVEIGRLVLSGLAVTPDRAERIRALLEVELGCRLEQEGWPDGLLDSDLSHLAAPTMHLAAPHSDRQVASSLAQRIVQSLRSARLPSVGE